MVFIAVFIYTGISGETLGLRKSLDDFYQTTNQADAYVYGENLSDETAHNLKNIDGVMEVQRRLELPTVAALEHKPEVTVYFLESNEISRPLVREGELFNLETDGIWLSERFASANALKIAADFTVEYEGLQITKRIAGLVYSSEYVFNYESAGITPNFKDYGFGFVSAKYFPLPEKLSYNQVLIKSDTDSAELKNQIMETTN
ncbi:MAG: hypothetical protein LBQ02_03380 [Candidatus Nomurabacteria bacterium]|jgi:putative ABC transport system permease protein|nr:hypothetical protein [Candidatus Nomurabacteria bacterium]